MLGKDKRMRIAIAGPGRSGTSLLVQLLAAWGFRTPDGPWYDDAAAGLEARLGSRPDLEVEKDPWAFEYLDRLDAEVLSGYDAFIIPVRRRQDAAISRAVRDRVQRAVHLEGDEWQWDTWGVHAGGAVVETTADAVSTALGKGLWDLLDVVSAAGLQPIIVHFPRFALDFDYLWAQMSSVVGARIEEEAARVAWAGLVDPAKIRITSAGADDARLSELTAVVNEVRATARRALTAQHAAESELTEMRRQVAERETQVDQQHREIDRLHAEVKVRDDLVRHTSEAVADALATIDAMRASPSWRITRLLRRNSDL